MRFVKFLNEDEYGGVDQKSFDDLKAELKQDCKLYFNLLKRANAQEPLYRGLYNTGLYVWKKPRTDRTPMAMPFALFQTLNQFLKNNGHVPRDSSVSTTPNYSHSVMFGVPHYFFPAKDFNFTVFISKFHAVDLNMNKGFLGMLDRYTRYERKDNLLKPYFKSDDIGAFRKGLKLESEIWFNCPYYYAINVDLLEKVFGIQRKDALKALGGY